MTVVNVDLLDVTACGLVLLSQIIYKWGMFSTESCLINVVYIFRFVMEIAFSEDGVEFFVVLI